MNIRKRLRTHPEVHTGALNDILFILLLFFLIVSTLANPNVIKVSNPKAKSDTKSKQTVVITVDKDQQLYLGSQKITFEQLEPKNCTQFAAPFHDNVDKIRNFILFFFRGGRLILYEI